jgi:membrane protein implicated in regulation of membrane protease activity
MFLANLINAYLLLADVPESLALLVFGICLVIVTVGGRRLLSRYDERQTRQK